ncbi:MAG: methyltransferase domain-containing protein [Pigmentiphaga sp.]|nr:methyltransferase domain-containing protein [Pigmentiphaga sp.]
MAVFLVAPTHAQVSQFEPRVGQEGKDVVWVPTPQALVERMLDIAEVKPGEFLIDLGSGDGRTVITAAGRGLRAHGIEYNADMVELAKRAARDAGVTDRATFAQGDLFEADLSQADVITLFLLPSINEKLSPTLLDLQPGTRIVSNSFRMGDWESDESSTVDEDCSRWCTALLWFVPAKVEGEWTLDGQPLKFQQTYQRLEGTLGNTAIRDAALRGTRIAFTAGDARYVGTVDGNTMQGQVEGSGRAWRAARP